MPEVFTYSPARKAAHWLSAAAIAAAFALAWAREGVDEPSLRAALLNSHRALGMAVLLLALARLALKLRDGAAPALPNLSPLVARAATAMHGGLYALMLAQPLLGWAAISAKGRAFTLGPLVLPAIAPKSAELADLMAAAHEAVGAILAAAIVGHLAAVLYHTFWRRDGVLARMLPGAHRRSPATAFQSGE